MITVGQAVVLVFACVVVGSGIAFALGFALGFTAGRRPPLQTMADPAHAPRLDRTEAEWKAAFERTVCLPQERLDEDHIPDCLLWAEERRRG